MKFKMYSTASTLAILLFVTWSPTETRGLTCAPTYPLIGIVTGIDTNEVYSNVILRNYYSFEYLVSGTSPISIDEYEKIAGNYIENNFELEENVDIPDLELFDWARSINVNNSAIDLLNIASGDIVIQGPPFHVCSYRFTGVFSSDGTFRGAVVDDNYNDYLYKGGELIVERGAELMCDSNGICSIEVNYTLDGTQFKLSPGESKVFEKGAFKNIALIDSSDRNIDENGLQLFDWGFGTYVTQVFFFSDTVDFKPAPPLPDPTPEPPPTPEPVPNPSPKSPPAPEPSPEPTPPTPSPEPSPEPIPPVQSPEPAPTPEAIQPQPERLGLFQRIISWFTSLFR